MQQADVKLSHRVVINGQGQYSVWPAHKKLPGGWQATGFEDGRQACLEHIAVVWTDMRAYSLPVARNGGGFHG
ncbi:MbtH protein [Oxalobacteraceae bacterium GrIS 1.11]